MQKAAIHGCIVIAFSSLTWSAPPRAFTISDVMSAPFASELIAAPAGARVAWLEYQEGRRNVWVASAPQWQGMQVTKFAQDDGQEISGLRWSPSGDSVIFVRGGDSENGGENPNPAQAPTLPSEDIWRVTLNGSAPVVSKLTEGHLPEFSPSGNQIAFIRKSEIFTMKSDGQSPTVIVHDKGHAGSLTWSPDGSALSFVTHRSEHSFIGVYFPETKSIRYLDASVDEDLFPSWSPDSASIVFVRIPVGVGGVSAPHRADTPWSLRTINLQTGAAKELFHANVGQGSVYHDISSDRQVHWLANNTLIFPWEKNGWCHLYSISATGGEPVDLTPGDGEVETVSSGGGQLFYSTNISDIDARHIWQISPKAERVTMQDGVQIDPAPTADGSALAFLASTYNTPIHAAVRLANGEMKDLHAGALPAAFPIQQLAKPQSVLINAADGLTIHAQLFLPPNDGRRHPALVFFHGGSRRQMFPAFHYMFYYSNAYAMNQYLASQGYVVLAVNYRSGIGYGLDFREALNYGVAGASEFNDVMGAGLYLRSRTDVDPRRIGAWGGSYGGYLTALALARSSDLFAAGVDFHGVHDWSTLRGYELNPSGGDAAKNFKQQEIARLAFESSPMASVSGWRSPVLLIHGDDDRNVEFPQTEELVKALRQQKVEFEQLIFPNEIHDFLLHKSWVDAYKATADFFGRKLNTR